MLSTLCGPYCKTSMMEEVPDRCQEKACKTLNIELPLDICRRLDSIIGLQYDKKKKSPGFDLVDPDPNSCFAVLSNNSESWLSDLQNGDNEVHFQGDTSMKWVYVSSFGHKRRHIKDSNQVRYYGFQVIEYLTQRDLLIQEMSYIM